MTREQIERRIDEEARLVAWHRALSHHLDNPTMGETHPEHIVIFRDVMELANAQRSILERGTHLNILEIGFNRGSSALSMLLVATMTGLPSRLTSVDIADFTPGSKRYLRELFGEDVFRFYQMDSHALRGTPLTGAGTFDLVFIDGDHGEEAVRNDIEVALEHLKPTGVMLFDDYIHPGHGYIAPVCESHPGIELMEVYHWDCGLAAYKRKEVAA